MKKISFQVGFRRNISRILILMTLSASSVFGDKASSLTTPITQKVSAAETGTASYYGIPYHGRQTASGEVYDMNELTAAHPRLAFGTRVKVTDLTTNRSVIVRINDRGPFVKGRIIDLSQAAATELQMIRRGLTEVKLEIVQ